MKKHGKHYTPEEKVATLNLLDKEPISKLRDELGSQPTGRTPSSIPVEPETHGRAAPFSASQAHQFPGRSGSPAGLSIGQSDEAKGRMLLRALRARVAIRPSDTIQVFAPGGRRSPRTQVLLAASCPPFDPLYSQASERSAHHTPEGSRSQPPAVRSPVTGDG